MARILLQQIQQEANNIQWKLISTQYQNLKSELHFICPNQHEVITTYEKWRRTPTCPICQQIQKQREKQDIISQPKGKEDYRVLALDQATKISGWAIFENGKLLQYGIYETSSELESKRINDIKNWLLNMILIWKIDFVQLEDIQLQDHKEDGGNGEKIGVTTYKVLAHLQGVLENLLFTNNIEYDIVPPATWRKYCEIKGKNKTDKKKSAQLKIKDEYNINCSLDEAEAICIGKYATLQHTKNTQILEWG